MNKLSKRCCLIIVGLIILLSSCSDDNNTKQTEPLYSSTETEDTTLSDTEISDTKSEEVFSTKVDIITTLQSEESHDNNELSDECSSLTKLTTYLEDSYNSSELLNSQADDKVRCGIYLFDYNNDFVQDAIVEIFNGNGFTYSVIENIDSPQTVYIFSSFDKVEFFYDVKIHCLVLKYLCNYGLISEATSEENYIFLDDNDEIKEIKHIHYLGTGRPEEYYLDINGEKTTCNENDIKLSIEEIKKNLQSFTDFKLYIANLYDSKINIESEK